MNYKFVSTLFICLLISSSSYAAEKKFGIEKAEGPRLSKAVGHYSRARQLLLSAIREFDKGVKVASPEILIDITKWKESVGERAHDLETIIAPQPRVTKEGVTYDAEIKIFDNKR